MIAFPSLPRSRRPALLYFQATALLGAALLMSLPASAQQHSASAGVANNEVVSLSRFEVMTTQDRGYVANNAASALKTNQELMKIPQSVTVVTRDLIEDIGATRTSDVLQFAGASQFYRGESIRLRGARILNSYLDDSIENVFYSDNVNIDSYDVIRGPAAVLYPNAALGGVVLKSSKKPLPYARNTLSFSVKDYGEFRTEIDSTGPLGTLGEARGGYRFAGAWQDGDTFLDHMSDKRIALHPTVQVDLRNTTFRAAFDYGYIESPVAGTNFALPDGSIYTGAGRKEGYYIPGAMDSFRTLRQRVALLHRFSTNWESRTSLSHLEYLRRSTTVLPLRVDLAAETITLFARRNWQRQRNWVVNQDFVGNYRLFGLANQSAAGFTLTDEIVRGAFFNANGATHSSGLTAPLWGADGTMTFPIAAPNLSAVTVPSYGDYGSPRALGTWTNNRRSTYYLQQQVELIPERLTVVGGMSWASLHSSDVPNVAARAPTVVTLSEELYRVGLVVNLTKDIALYAMNSTTFAPQQNSNSRDYFGNLLPATSGEGKELGLKVALMGGRISATLSYFDMEMTNVGVEQPGLSPITGFAWLVAEGLQKQKGWDASLSLAPIENWQLVATAYDGDVTNQNGAQVNNTYRTLYSVFTRYDFRGEWLRGLSLGGGASRTGGNYFATPSGNYVFPVGVTPAPIELKPEWNTQIFASYRYGQHWTFRMSVENVLDKTFALGAQSPIFVDRAAPRTFTFSAAYKF